MTTAQKLQCPPRTNTKNTAIIRLFDNGAGCSRLSYQAAAGDLLDPGRRCFRYLPRIKTDKLTIGR